MQHTYSLNSLTVAPTTVGDQPVLAVHNGGTLQIEIGGTAQVSQYDFVSVTETALLGGNLELARIDGFTPDRLDTFTVLSAGSLIPRD